MRTVGNVLWLLLAGWWLALAYVLAGLVACVLIVTIPFGLQAFKLATYALWPFGRVAVPDPDADQALGLLGNVVWLLVCGVGLALAHLVAGLVLCLTIVGIPLGLGSFKMVPLALAPFGKVIVPADSPAAAGPPYPVVSLG
ncbi:MAG TPA: YccF domain-containing protein [Acidimicrobiales bacterium]